MNKLTKTACACLVVAGTAALAVGCGSSSNTTTVTVWTWRSQDQPLWQEVQDALNKKGDHVKIEFRAINPTSYDSVLQTAMDGGKGPDIFYARAGEGTLKYAAANMLEPLDGIVDFSKVSPAALASAQYQGKTYGVPFAIQTMEVFYNKQIFNQYHLSVPKTWNEWIHDCQVLKQNGVTPIVTMGIQSWMLALNCDEIGASLLTDDFTKKLVNKQVDYTAPEYVNVLRHYQQLADYFEPNFNAVGSGGNEQEQQFALGKAAMVMDGIFSVQQMLKYNPNLQIGAFLVPPDDPKGTAKIDWYVDGNIVMNSHISEPNVQKAAKDIMAFAATTEFGQDFANIGGEISPIAGVTIPSKYPLSVQAYKWYQTVPINPIFGIRSPMDTPPPTPVNAPKSQAANTDTGIFSAEQKVLLPLLMHEITPEKAAQEIQKQVAWYFKK